MRQRCIAGELSDCERVCGKGIAGEGGCFHAAQLYRTRAAEGTKSGDFAKARRYFEKACEGRHADGCLFWAQMLEAGYAGPEDAQGDALPALVSDADVIQREQRLGRACELGSEQGCRRLGDVFIGKNAANALDAYTKACSRTPQPAACIEQWKLNVGRVEELRVACTSGDADRCTALGDALFVIDPPRAIRLFASEYELRGVGPVAGSVGRFVRARIEEARRRGGGTAPANPEPGEGAAGPFSLRVDGVEGQLALVEAERVLTRTTSASLPECARSLRGETGETKLRLTIDLTGDVYRAEPVASTLNAPTTECVARALEAVTFRRTMPALATIDAVVAAGTR